jgi:hypothetical protein
MINKIQNLRNRSSVGQTTGTTAPVYTAQDIIEYNALLANGKVYTKFDGSSIIKDNVQKITGPIWSTGLASLTTHFTSSTQTNLQRQYYVDVQNALPSLSDSFTNYSIAYGNAVGSGSAVSGEVSDTPSRAIYSQFKQILLGPTDTRFTTFNSGSTDSIYVISFKRSQLKERLDIGNFEIPLANITSRSTNATGSVAIGSTVFTVIDDSSIASSTKGEYGRVYNLVSGSLLGGGVYKSGSLATPVYYGLVYPDYGIIILDGNRLDQQLGFRTNVSQSSEGNNQFALFSSISGSALVTNPTTSAPYGFQARNSEKITSTRYFVNIKSADYNFSNNPSYVTGSVGTLSQTSFINDPKVYITTIGLYNERTELLAVAKLSRPILKSFDREANIQVKLDF